ncbi:galactokinase [Psychrobacillus psychrodurans]|uniref:galactokinase n=1 Tax=Psychrobacillus psychrodurans TaxID=126157 RepID=UPI001F4DA0A9|nr:galactokinase [Psychrobacillus psychrodurans]MCK1998392.1 galactokinase [Psychrobacillus psychrodurans]
MNINELIKCYQSTFETTGLPRSFFAPGRINLIGEHTDYNGGYVFPASISYGTYAFVQKRDDQLIRFFSLNFPAIGIIECDLADLFFNPAHDWANYPKGMIKYIRENNLEISNGMDILFYGNIPNGAGLSSSASIEMVTGVLLEGLFDIPIDRIDMIKIGQKVENEYIGVNSGIMDQFAIGKGKKNHALLLNCQTLEYEYAPIQLERYVIIVINTNKKRTLVNSKYNERRAQCEKALQDLQTELLIQCLSDLSIEQFEHQKHLIQDDTNRKRAKHVVYENDRTLKTLLLLRQGNLKEFGRLMNESHLSLQNDFEVTGIELDTLVTAAWNQPGILGARMTGAGFGGCAIAIVEKSKIDSFRDNVNKIYTDKIGYEASFYTATIADGAREIHGGVL